MEEKALIGSVKLGAHGPMVGAQGLGCMGMSEFYGASDARESIATLHAALDCGVNLLDTADAYGRGANERLVGEAIRERRQQVFLATKFALERAAGANAPFEVNNRPEYIRACAEGSLSRLGTDVIDLYYMHRRDRAIPLADSIGAMAELVKAGKVRHLGLSEVTAEELRDAHAIHPITALQSEWSLFSRDVENDIVPAAAKLGIAFVAYSPLGRGQLSGNWNASEFGADDIRSRFPRFSSLNAGHNAKLVGTVASLAQARGWTAAQLALAWVHHRSKVHRLTVIPIPGTRKQSRLVENVRAARIELDNEVLTALEPLAAGVEGDRSRQGAFRS